MRRIERICSVVNDETLEQLERVMLAYINGVAHKQEVIRRTKVYVSEKGAEKKK